MFLGYKKEDIKFFFNEVFLSLHERIDAKAYEKSINTKVSGKYLFNIPILIGDNYDVSCYDLKFRMRYVSSTEVESEDAFIEALSEIGIFSDHSSKESPNEIAINMDIMTEYADYITMDRNTGRFVVHFAGKDNAGKPFEAYLKIDRPCNDNSRRERKFYNKLIDMLFDIR